MYEIITTIHSVLRWFIIAAFLFALYRTFSGWRRSGTWQKQDKNAGTFLVIFMDLQLVLGLILFFFLSPLTEIAFQDMGSAMSNTVVRFYTVEHFLLMLIAIVLIHVGLYKSRRAEPDRKRHRLAFIYYLIAFILVLVAIPWPFLAYGRPLI